MMLSRRRAAGAYQTWPPRQDFKRGLAREVEHDAANSPGHSGQQIRVCSGLTMVGSGAGSPACCDLAVQAPIRAGICPRSTSTARRTT
jgi:hypothetical protein